MQGADTVLSTQGCKVNKQQQQQQEHWQRNQLTSAPPLEKGKKKNKEPHIHSNVEHQGARETALSQEKEEDECEEGRARKLSHELSTNVIYLTREAI